MLSTFESCSGTSTSELASEYMSTVADADEEKVVETFATYCYDAATDEKQPCLEEFMSVLAAANILEDEKATNHDDGVEKDIVSTCECE